MSDERFLQGQSEGNYFSVSAKELSDLFDNELVKTGESLKKVKSWGGFQGLQTKLKVDIDKGLHHSDSTDLSAREQHFGNNHSITKPMKKIWDLITVQFEDEILRILCYAAGVSLIMGIATEGIKHGWMEGFAIFVAVIIIVSVTAINDYQKELQFRKLYATAESRNVTVTRDGQVKHISIYDILVGDLLTIETGDILPVDGIVTISNDIVMDESSATGESDPVKKRVPKNFDDAKQNPFMISGTQVSEGSGQCLVLAVGKESQQGKAKLLLSEDDDDATPLQGKLDVLAGQIGDYGMLVAKLVFFAMTIHLLVEDIYTGRDIFVIETVKYLVEYFIIAVTVIVVAVPEGLPLAVTIALAYSVGKMKDENNLVRVLATCETMGGANNICSDKTGTLTKNDMEVTNLWCCQTQNTLFDQKTLSEKPQVQDKLCVGIAVNSNANPQITGNRFEKIGNKTECALLELAWKLGYDFHTLRPSPKILRTIPFSSKKKRMSVIYQQDSDTYRVFVKGAPDWLHPLTKYYLNRQGQRVEIDEAFEQERDKVIKQYADKALRTLLLTYSDIPASSIQDVKNMDAELLEEIVVKDLTVVAVAGIADPLRPEVPHAVQQCKEAGVMVRMVTGDVRDTAVAISKNAGIISENYDPQIDKYTVMTGKEFREFVGGKKEIRSTDNNGNEQIKYEVGNLENFKIVYENTRVIARSSPEDKYLLVTGIRQLGNVVAVTGDGTNDAPALKKADVGFAMGIAGTEVAKEAAGIILLDDNFKSIITAMKWGRNIFDCIRKFLQFQVTVNIVAMFMVFLGGVILRESPLTSIQMLWVNLIMDTMASLALATEPPTDELLKRQPYGRHEAMITPVMWRNIVSHGIWQIIVLLVVLFEGPRLFDIPTGIHNEHWTQENGVHFTMFFNIFVYMQVFNEINARKLKREEKNVFKGFFNNPMFLIVLIVTIVVQMLITTYGGRAVRCSELTMHQHLVCLFIGALSLVVGFVIKLVPQGCFNTITLFNNLEETGKPNIVHQLRKSRSMISRGNSRLSRNQPV